MATKPTVGSFARVRDGVVMPEFPELTIGGLTGEVIEVRGRGAQRKVVLRWDTTSIARLPEGFREECEAKQLAADLVCLLASDVTLLAARDG